MKQKEMRRILLAITFLTAGQTAFAQQRFTIPLFIADGHPTREGFARVINHSDRAGTVNIVAIDDDGNRSEPIVVSLGAKAAVQFNSGNLENGNLEKGLSGGVGDGTGDWRLELTTDLEIEPLAYVRTNDGFLTSVHEVVPNGEYVPIFNPGSNSRQQSRLRVINPNEVELKVVVVGLDDGGSYSREDHGDIDAVSVTLPPGAARSIASRDLETGGDGLEGALGDGRGKWQLALIADLPLLAMSLLESETGHLTNLSTLPAYRDRTVPLFLSASEPDKQGFVRIFNYSDWLASVDVTAIDDVGRRVGPISVSLGEWETVHFNSSDLENGNPSKGISQGVGGGSGNWRLEMNSVLPIRISAFVRTTDGFLTSIHDVGRRTDARHYLPIFNPGSNESQASLLRLVNPGERDVEIEVEGTDDDGNTGADTVRFTLEAGMAKTISARDLELGTGRFQGMLGDGSGKWRLTVTADGPVHAMSLMQSASGELTNLSRTFDGGLGQPSLSYKLTGEDHHGALGRQVSSAGDVDGDGVPDLIIGAPGTDANPEYRDYEGTAYLVSGTSLARVDAQGGEPDGLVELGDAVTQGEAWKFIGEAGGDLAGLAVATAGDVDGDGRPDLLIGAPHHDTGAIDAGAVYVVSSSELPPANDASSDGFVSLQHVATWRKSYKLVGEAHHDNAGASLAPVGDLDGDGIADFAVGAPGGYDADDHEEGMPAPGTVYVVSGASLPGADRADGLEDGVVELANVARQRGCWKLLGEEDYDHMGTSVASAGDVNGDGLPDVIIGARRHTAGTGDTIGAAYLISASVLPMADAADGDSDGVIRIGNVAAQPDSWKLIGEENEDDWVGQSVASAGDLDGDGLADIIVGPWVLFYDTPVYAITAGALASVDEADGKADGVLDLGNVGSRSGSWKLVAQHYAYNDGGYSSRRSYYTRAGFSVAPAGDVDGDGLADFLVGTRNGGRHPEDSYDVRAAFLLAGGDLDTLDDATGDVDGVVNLDAVRFQATSSWQFVGEGEDNAGVSVAPAGDVDGDSFGDLLIGADEAGADDNGAVYLVSAADLAVLDLADGIADGYILIGNIVRD